MNSAWPNWIVNIGIIATLIGTFVTFFVLYQTSRLSKNYNKKISAEYITSNVKDSYERFSLHIRDVVKEKFSTNEGDIKYEIWSLILKCNGHISVCKKNDTDKKTYTHIEKFKKDTLGLQDKFKKKDSLTYENVWSYYNSLTVLHEALRNEELINARRV
ncbi:hypothetical protein [Serratia marcescens]|uniref:hypothetical protein n=1 Tax=Serratia marcescens TaxID=615 RepID=UPI00124AC764|nr:hypothetical protein [Serratia marcescens]KAB1580486.1 hypothetical protein F7687_15265 [Serratia marcescens]